MDINQIDRILSKIKTDARNTTDKIIEEDLFTNEKDLLKLKEKLNNKESDFYKKDSQEADFKHKLEMLKLIHQDEKNTIELRRKFAWCILIGSGVFTLAVVVIVFLSGHHEDAYISSDNGMHPVTYLMLPTPVTVALIGTGMVQVLGILYIVAKWLFPQKT